MPDATPPALPQDPAPPPGTSPETRAAPSSWHDDLIVAATFLTRVPLHRVVQPHDPRASLAPALRAFPLIGALIGLAAGRGYAAAGRLGPAPPDGLAASLGRPGEAVIAQAVILGVLLCGLVAGPFAGIVALSFAALALAGLETLARRQIGGYTGDVLGAAQQVTETAILLALSVVW